MHNNVKHISMSTLDLFIGIHHSPPWPGEAKAEHAGDLRSMMYGDDHSRLPTETLFNAINHATST